MARRRREVSWIEALAWLAALALLSPLVLYARAGFMPLPALFGVATGIALSLMLVGRRLYDAMMADALSGRPQTGAFFMTVGLVLLAIFLVVLGGAVALFFAFRGSAPKPPI